MNVGAQIYSFQDEQSNEKHFSDNSNSLGKQLNWVEIHVIVLR